MKKSSFALKAFEPRWGWGEQTQDFPDGPVRISTFSKIASDTPPLTFLEYSEHAENFIKQKNGTFYIEAIPIFFSNQMIFFLTSKNICQHIFWDYFSMWEKIFGVRNIFWV